MPEQLAPEPTMDEILASIRRIISEDEAPAETAVKSRPEPAGKIAPVEPEPVVSEAETKLEAVFSEPAAHVEPEPEPVVEAAAHSEPVAEPHPEPAFRDVIASSVEPAPEPEPVEPPHPVAVATFEPQPIAEESPMSSSNDTLMDDSAAAKASSSLDKLSAAVKSVAPTASPGPTMPSGVTLEDITKDLLRPLLKTWLDENLPIIVQEKVEEAVARITGKV